MLDVFYRAVLPGTGPYTLFVGPTKQHVWVDTLEELVAATEARKNTKDLYFATAAYKEPTTRTQDNVRALRAFRLDLDAGEEKYAKYGDRVYRTRQDALKGLKEFLDKTKLVPTFVVGSGWGLHVYFCLDEDIAPAQWKPVAIQLQKLAVHTGLKVDSTVTCDEARILRPPGTLHSKSGNRVEIILRSIDTTNSLENFALRLGTVVTPEPVTALTKKYDMSINDDVLEVQGPPRSIRKIITRCAAIHHAGTHQDKISEPMWRAMLGVVKFTTEGEKAAHALSKRHPEYDPIKTAEKFDGWTAGPATCDSFAAEFDGCAQCEYRGKIKSPIVLGSLNVEEVAALPPEAQPTSHAPPTAPNDPWHDRMPEGFWVGSEGCLMTNVVVEKEDPNTKEKIALSVPIVLAKSIFWFSSWAESDSSHDNAKANMHTRVKGRIKTYEFDQGLAGVKNKMMEYLSGRSIFPTTDPKAEKLIMDYTRAALERLKHGSQRLKITDRVGLRIVNGELLAVHGRHVIHPDGKIVNAMVSDEVAPFAENFSINTLPASDFGEWGVDVWSDIRSAAEDHAAFLRTYYGAPGFEPYQLAIMLGMASPFMAFVTGEYADGATLPPNGMSVSLYSRASGRGKTTAVKSAMLAYGKPDELVKDANKMASTDIARMSKLSLSGTMPMSMDEMGSTDENAIAQVVSAVANASARSRSKQYGGVSSGARWSLINLITANRSARDMISTFQKESSAIQMRLLELDASTVPDLSSEQLAAFQGDFARVKVRCTGALGALIHFEMCKAGPVKLNAEVAQCVHKAAQLIGGAQEARFLYRSFGAVIALQLTLKRLGIDLFDLKKLANTFVAAYEDAAAYTAVNSMPATGVELLEKCLNDLRPQIFVTQTMTHGGRDKNKQDTVLSATGRTPDDPVGRYVRGMDRLYLRSDAITKWAHDNKISPNDIVRECKTGSVFVPHAGFAQPGVKLKSTDYLRRVDLFKGLGVDGVSNPYCYIIDMAKLRSVDLDATDTNVIPFPGKPEAAPATDQEATK